MPVRSTSIHEGGKVNGLAPVHAVNRRRRRNPIRIRRWYGQTYHGWTMQLPAPKGHSFAITYRTRHGADAKHLVFVWERA